MSIEFFNTLAHELQQKLGYQPRESLENLAHGNCVRFGKKNKAFIYINQFKHNNEDHYDATFGTWSAFHLDREAKFHLSSLGDLRLQTKTVQKKIETIRKINSENKRKSQLEENKELIKEFMPIYMAAKPAPHPYLTKKKLPQGINKVINGSLILPMYNQNLEICGFQEIKPEKDFNGLDKKMMPRSISSGSIYHLKDFSNAKKVYLTEGWADAATLQMFTDWPCITAFSAGNLPAAIKTIRQTNKDCLIILAGDNDETGRAAVNKCLEQYSNISSIFPKKEKDFNDEYLKHGENSILQTLSSNIENPVTIVCLGMEQGNYFYAVTNAPQVISLSFKEHNESGLMHLYPNSKYWFDLYGEVSERGVPYVDWRKASEILQMNCRKIGRYDPTKIRGTGIWFEGDTMVINNGIRAINQPENSLYFYERFKPFNYQAGDISHMVKWVEELTKVKHKEPTGGLYLAAWFIQSYIFPAISWRFSLWLTASAGTGKSTLFKWLARTGLFCRNTPDSTAAGVRQACQSNQTAICYDESESDEKDKRDRKKSQKISDVLDFARTVNSKDSGEVLRGSASQKAIVSNPQVTFCFASIQVAQLNSADVSRFLICELVPQGSDETFDRREMLVNAAENQQEAFFYFATQNIDYIQEARKIAKTELLNYGVIKPRQRDQISSVVGCYSLVYKAKGIPVNEAVNKILSSYNWADTDYIKESSVEQSEIAIDDFLDLVVSSTDNLTVGKALSEIKEPGISDTQEQALASFGIKYLGDTDEIFIHHNNKRLVANLPSVVDLPRMFSRFEGIELKKGQSIRINGKPRKGIKITAGFLGK